MDVPTPCSDERVLGVTVPVPEPWASRVRLVRARAGDPLARSIGPHITLLPPTAVPVARLEEVHEHLVALAAKVRPFVIELDGVGTFRPLSPVVYLRVTRGADELDRLQTAVRDPSGPLARELRFPFHPHVTLAHEVDDDALDATARAGAALGAEIVADRLELRALAADGDWELLRVIALAGPGPTVPPTGDAAHVGVERVGAVGPLPR